MSADKVIRTIEEIGEFSILRPVSSIADLTPSDSEVLGRGFIHVGTGGTLVLEVQSKNGLFIDVTITNFVGGFLDRFIIRKVKTGTTATEIDFYNLF